MTPRYRLSAVYLDGQICPALSEATNMPRIFTPEEEGYRELLGLFAQRAASGAYGFTPETLAQLPHYLSDDKAKAFLEPPKKKA